MQHPVHLSKVPPGVRGLVLKALCIVPLNIVHVVAHVFRCQAVHGFTASPHVEDGLPEFLSIGLCLFDLELVARDSSTVVRRDQARGLARNELRGIQRPS